MDDELAIRVNIKAETNANTKRNILSEIAQIYDPIGLIAAFSEKVKCIMQDLWRDRDIDWDTNLNGTKYVDEWRKLYAEMRCLTNFRIARWLGTSAQAEIKLYGFADASKRAYECCITYARYTRAS